MLAELIGFLALFIFSELFGLVLIMQGQNVKWFEGL